MSTAPIPVPHKPLLLSSSLLAGRGVGVGFRLPGGRGVEVRVGGKVGGASVALNTVGTKSPRYVEVGVKVIVAVGRGVCVGGMEVAVRVGSGVGVLSK